MLRIIRSIWRRLTSKNYSNEQPLVRLGQGDYEREIWYSAHDKTGVSPEDDNGYLVDALIEMMLQFQDHEQYGEDDAKAIQIAREALSKAKGNVDDLKVAAEEGRIVTDSLETILATVRGTFPEAEIGDDNSGQVIIYTGLYQVGDSSTPLVSSEDLFLRRAAMLEGELEQ